MGVEVNELAVLLAAVSSMITGAIWYDNRVFGKTWRKLAKLDPKNMPDTKSLVIAFISSLLMAYTLAHVTFFAHAYYGNSFLADAFVSGFWMWTGFQVTRMVMRDSFEKRPRKLTFINIGNDFVTIMVMAAIIGSMKV